MPLAKVSASNRPGVITPVTIAAHSNSAMHATQNCVMRKRRLRSRMSASAPLGSPSTNTGRVDAVCTSATQIGKVVSDVIIQAAATSFIHCETLAASQVNHNMRNTGKPSDAQGESEAARGTERPSLTGVPSRCGLRCDSPSERPGGSQTRLHL